MSDITLSPQLRERIEREIVIWLTTVREDGMPQPTPVWFVWDEDSFLIYSQPDAFKVRNIAQNPRVALNFNSDSNGNEVFVIFGEAAIDVSAPPVNKMSAYLAKYTALMPDLGLTPNQYAEMFSLAIRIYPIRVREMNVAPTLAQMGDAILALSPQILHVEFYQGDKPIDVTEFQTGGSAVLEAIRRDLTAPIPSGALAMLGIGTQAVRMTLSFPAYHKLIVGMDGGYVAVYCAHNADVIALIDEVQRIVGRSITL